MADILSWIRDLREEREVIDELIGALEGLERLHGLRRGGRPPGSRNKEKQAVNPTTKQPYKRPLAVRKRMAAAQRRLYAASQRARKA